VSNFLFGFLVGLGVGAFVMGLLIDGVGYGALIALASVFAIALVGIFTPPSEKERENVKAQLVVPRPKGRGFWRF
jgi:predicted MFS family arabinose efflux permease